MFEKFRRVLGVPQPRRRAAAPVMRTRYHWICACGGHSRDGGFLLRSQVEYAIDRHLWSKEEGHPVPEIKTTEEKRPY
ncbi:hypothetical protein [Streptomyces sp. NPDC054865]